MILYVYDPDFTLVGMIDSFVSVIWEEDYRGIGKFMLECVDTEHHVSLFRQGYYVFRKGIETAMVIRYISYNSTTNMITVRGNTANDLLSQRVVYPMMQITNIEQGMYNIISANARDLKRFVLASPQGFTDSRTTQFTGNGLIEALTDLAALADFGYKTVFDLKNKRHVFTVYRGLDRSDGNGKTPVAIFTDEVGNLNNMQIIDDNSIFKNFAYVGGMGEGSERVWTQVYTGDSEPTGLDRFEMTVDARDLQKDDGESDAAYLARLQTRGVERLNEHYNVKTFLAEPDTQKEKPTLVWGVDYHLGDIVSCKSARYNYRIDTRIMRYTETRQDNITTIICTLGDPIISQKILSNLRG